MEEFRQPGDKSLIYFGKLQLFHLPAFGEWGKLKNQNRLW
jgi:hypothetical protein